VSEPDASPFRLAQLHLGEHGFARYECRTCGVAKAIIDYASSVAEEAGYEFVETVRKNRLDLVSKKRQLEKSIASFCSAHAEKDRRTREASRSPVEDVMVLQPGQMSFKETPIPSKQTATAEEVYGSLAWMLGPLREALCRWDSLVSGLVAAEEHLSGGVATPSLAERRNRWPRDYVETKVDCYLSQHGWEYQEIYAFHLPGQLDKGNRPGRKIEERVRRAKESGKPPLIWSWPGEQNEKEARRILDLVMDVLDKQHLSATR
jgi:hypothetical protein